MMNKFFMLLFVFVPFMVSAQTNQQEPLRLTLIECIEQAQENNYSRKSVILDESAQNERYSQSKMERLPGLSASLGESYSYTRENDGKFQGNYSLNADMVLYQGGEINRTIEKNKLLKEQTSQLSVQYDNNLTIQVLQAYMNILGNEELLHSQQALLATTEEQVRQGKIRFETGEILESDYLLLEAQYASDKNNVTETEINLKNNLNALKVLMSVDPSQQLEIVAPQDEIIATLGLLPSEEEVLERAFETLPDLKISAYNVQIAKSEIGIAKSAYMPKLSLNAGVGSAHYNNYTGYGTQLDNNLNAQVGVTLSIPILNHNRTKSNVAQSKIKLQQAELDNKQTQLDTKQSIIEEYRNVIVAESTYKASERRQNAYLASFEAYQAKFEQGAITTVDLLQQQNNYINALYEYIQGKYGFMLKRKVLDVYMGEPVSL